MTSREEASPILGEGGCPRHLTQRDRLGRKATKAEAVLVAATVYPSPDQRVLLGEGAQLG
jgi:hypothetical protein